MLIPRNKDIRITLIIVAVILIAAITGGVSYFNFTATGKNIKQDVRDRTQTVAQLIDQEKVKWLSNSSEDESTPTYTALKKTLAKLKESNPDALSIYITEMVDGKIVFSVDSEDPGTPYFSSPGEEYLEATPLFKSVFSSKEAAVEGPVKDTYGEWVSGLAPIIDKDNGEVIAVVGMDMGAWQYDRQVWAAALYPIVIGAGLISLVMIFGWAHIRERNYLQARSELVSVATHEIRSPLAAIRWGTELLMTKLEGTPHHTLLADIHNSAASLEDSIEDVLALSREDSGKRKLVIEECNMTEIVRGLCNTQKLVADQKRLILTLDTSWPETVTVRCDSELMKRALLNIISNALKYTRENTAVVISYAKTDKWHAITVTDQGIGIPKDEQKKVFKGFYRATNARESGIIGTGMGLYLTRTVIKEHHGDLAIKSEVGVGTSVTLYLPL